VAIKLSTNAAPNDKVQKTSSAFAARSNSSAEAGHDRLLEYQELAVRSGSGAGEVSSGMLTNECVQLKSPAGPQVRPAGQSIF